MPKRQVAVKETEKEDIKEEDFEHPIYFREAVYKAARAQRDAAQSNVYQLKSA